MKITHVIPRGASSHLHNTDDTHLENNMLVNVGHYVTSALMPAARPAAGLRTFGKPRNGRRAIRPSITPARHKPP